MFRRLPVCFALVLFSPALALAAEPSLVEWAKARVHEGIVKPLAIQKTKTISRGRPPPTERRVRVLSTSAVKDKSGEKFVNFAIDIRYGEDWKEDVRGCAYRETGYLFVKVGEAYRPADFLLGKNVKPAPGVCAEASPES